MTIYSNMCFSLNIKIKYWVIYGVEITNLCALHVCKNIQNDKLTGDDQEE